MSWEIYLTSFNEGEICKFSKKALVEILSRDCLDRAGPGEYRVDFLYPDGYLNAYIDEMAEQASGFALYKFYGLTALKRALEAATAFRCLIFWPGEDIEHSLAVAAPSVLAHLPRDLPAQPVVVTTAENFEKVLCLVGDGFSKEAWLNLEFSGKANTRAG